MDGGWWRWVVVCKPTLVISLFPFKVHVAELRKLEYIVATLVLTCDLISAGCLNQNSVKEDHPPPSPAPDGSHRI